MIHILGPVVKENNFQCQNSTYYLLKMLMKLNDYRGLQPMGS